MDRLVREHVAEEGKGEVFRFTRPEMRFRYHPMLAFQAYIEWQARDFRGQPLSPAEVAGIDWEWRRDLNRIGDLFSFHRRPATGPGYRASRPNRG